MQYQHNVSLKDYNTFGIDVKAKKFISVKHTNQLLTVLKENTSDFFFIGGGSNMLLLKDVDKTVVHLDIKGIIVNNETDNNVEVTAYAGENWHEFILWCIEMNYGGLENLSLIPGNVGSCPIQNIGAYGVEVKDTITSVEVLNKKTLEIEKFSNAQCEFGYRNSVFKNKLKDQYVILSVTFKLTTQNHQVNIGYGAIQEELQNNTNPNLKEISDAVINIRNSKLPNPKIIGNSGSFFKNPVIPLSLYHEIKTNFPNIPSYPVSETSVKVPAGWLIEQAGFKGKKFGNTGVHHQQALVLVNHGNATGIEVYELAKEIQKTILEKFNISLEIEVNII